MPPICPASGPFNVGSPRWGRLPHRQDVLRSLNMFASFPHEVWQVDAGEQKTLASGQKVSWLRFADECSGAILKTFVFSPRPLQSGSPVRCPTAFSPGFEGARPARPIPHGQRCALGFARRSADAVRIVAFGIGDPTGVEPAPATPIQRRRGAPQSLGERLGRTGHLPDPRKFALPISLPK